MKIIMLVYLAMVATMVALVQANSLLSKCEIMSEIIAKQLSENKPLGEFIQNNCPSGDYLRHIFMVAMAARKQQDDLVLAGQKQYKIYTEQKEEQANWLAEAQAKVSGYFSELADLIESPESATSSKTFEYPSSSAIDGVLSELDNDNEEMISTNPNFYFLLMFHGGSNDDEGFYKFLKALEKKQLLEKVVYGH